MPQSHWQSPSSSCYGSVVALSILFTYLVLVSVLVLFCADFYSGVIQCFAAIVNHLIPFLNSIFADYSDDWFIPFVGDDVLA